MAVVDRESEPSSKTLTAVISALFMLLVMLLGAWSSSNQRQIDKHTEEIKSMQDIQRIQGERLAATEAHYADILRHLDEIKTAVERSKSGR